MMTMMTEMTLTRVLANLNLPVKTLNVFPAVIQTTLATTITSKTKKIQEVMQQHKTVEMMTMMTEMTLTRVLDRIKLANRMHNVYPVKMQ
jgi:hypothetical protein